MTIRNTYAAEAWDKVYSAFSQINFTSYDYDTVKESLLQYLKIYYAEHFNDFIESSELIAVLELFAYVAELLAYRVDMASHENFITTAQRKASILRLAKLISYRASRNIPARGLVKLNTVRTSEDIYDSLGNNLANVNIIWNDPNNTNWKEQFFLVMNKVLTTRFGQPSKSFQIADVLMQLYTFNNNLNAFKNGVYAFSAAGTTDQTQMEAVPIDIDANGPFERSPDMNAQFNLVYASDGKGDGSDYTGFLMFVKQGTLVRTDYTILEPTANRRLELDSINVNDTDVWVYRVDDTNTIIESWFRVDSVAELNVAFNNQTTTRKKYEVESLENDRIALIFGDGNFSDAPVGDFQLWTRVSTNQNLTIPKNKISGQQMTFTYVNAAQVAQTFNMSFSLTSALQNNAASETIEHIRQSAPSTYYAQDRMVNGQDYNTFMLKDSTILRLKTINRTFAGQPKYIEWNDASGAYQNIKLFGDDLVMFQNIAFDSLTTTSSSKTLVDTYIEPLLQSNALLNTLVHAMMTSTDSYGIISYPRRKFIEDNDTIYKDVDGNNVAPYGTLQVGDGSLKEKTMIQGALDQHWYGDPLNYATINGTLHGVIPDPILNPSDDGKLYIADLPRTIDGINTYPPGDIGSGYQSIAPQKHFGLRFNRFLSAFGNGDIALYQANNAGSPSYGHGDVTLVPASGLDYLLVKDPADTSHGNTDGWHQSKIETITIEMTSDGATFTVISNIRGKLPDYSLSLSPRYSLQTNETIPVDFVITQGASDFVAGDAFVIDISYQNNGWVAQCRAFGTAGTAFKVNLNGWWQLIPESVLTTAGLFAGNVDKGPNLVQQMSFDPNNNVADSWIFLVSQAEVDGSGNVLSWSVYNRDIKIVVQSATTNFWYNQDTQIIDSQTNKTLYDKIRVLRSNLDEAGRPLRQADVYDVVGFVYDANGVIITNELEVLPTDTSTFTQAGDSTPDNILQFEQFTANAFQYTLVNISDPTNPAVVRTLACSEYVASTGYDTFPFDTDLYDTASVSVTGFASAFAFDSGSFASSNTTDTTPYQLIRTKYAPAPASVDPSTGAFGCTVDSGLDFMWQHYTPDSNLIDPSVTNIHDAFILTRGYYSDVTDYVNGLSNINPQPPTPLDLRTSYGYLLENKMLSDTVVLHPGKIKLLFGQLADQTLRASFRVLKSPTATFSDERIKSEVINVINTYFEIQNWDFGDTFYATELIGLIHQRLTTQISSVVLVPTYSVNSFGSLFTIDSGFDEVLQSAATVSDVQIVTALTPTVLRQIV